MMMCVKVITMPHQNQKNQASWLGKIRERSGRNPLILPLICIWARYDSQTEAEEGFQHRCPSLSTVKLFSTSRKWKTRKRKDFDGGETVTEVAKLLLLYIEAQKHLWVPRVRFPCTCQIRILSIISTTRCWLGCYRSWHVS